MKLLRLAIALSFASYACQAGTLVIGEASQLDDAAVVEPGDAGVFADATEPSPNGSPCEGVSGTCLEPSAHCPRRDEKGRTCARAGDICCLPVCPINNAPPAGCDGAPYVEIFSPGGCSTGWACAPLACETANGTCVAPGTCAPPFVGDASVYVCAASGAVCCLP